MAAIDPTVDEESKMADDFVQVYLVKLVLKGARNLVKADVFGKSDPYLTVEALEKRYSTKTIMKTLDPDWNEKTQFVFFEEPSHIKFTVWDWDKGTKDDEIGDVRFPLAGFFDPSHKGFDGDLNLQNVKKGQIFVSVNCRKLLPVALETRHKSLTDRKAEQIDTIAANKTTIAELEAGIASQTDVNNTLNTEIDGLREKTVQMQEDNSKLATEEDQTRLKMQGIEELKSDTAATLQSAKDEFTPVEKSFEETKRSIADMTDEITSLENEVRSLNDQISQREREIEQQREKDKAAAEAAKSKSETKPLTSKDESDTGNAGGTDAASPRKQEPVGDMSDDENDDKDPPAGETAGCCSNCLLM